MIDPETRTAFDLMESPMAKEDPIKVALSMFSMVLATLVAAGGRDAAVEILQGAIARVRGGHFDQLMHPVPHPNHPPGSA
jgi:hypothetical protein